jgi:tetratricopeptide (TPR) repeat protein
MELEELSSAESITFGFLKSSKEKKIESLLAQIAADPKNVDHYYDLGLEYYSANQYGKAIEYYTKAIELNSKRVLYYSARGASYGWLKEFEKAAGDYSKAIELEPDKALNYYWRGKSYNRLKKFNEAAADHSKAIELRPDKALYYTELARVLCRIGSADRAFENVEKAIKLDNNLPDGYNARGYIGLKIAKQAGSKCAPNVLNDLNNAVGLGEYTNSIHRFYTDRAEYFLYSGNLEAACKDLQEALNTNSRYGPAHYFLAKYHETKGNKQDYNNCISKSKEYRFIPAKDD